MLNFRNPGMVLGEILTVFTLAGATANGQALLKRTGNPAPESQAIYNSPDYNAAYNAAEVMYAAFSPQPFIPSSWTPKKPLLWVGFKEAELGRYLLALDDFKDQLDNASKNPQIRNNPEKLAQLSQIENRLTEDNLSALNAMVKNVDLSTFYISNHKPTLAEKWSVWQVPEGKPILDSSGLENVYKFARNLRECLSQTPYSSVQFSKSPKFSDVVPLEPDGTQMNKQDAWIFWRLYYKTPEIVNDTIANLYEDLYKAQMTAATERLLIQSGPQALRAIVNAPASSNNSASIATRQP